MAAAGYFLIGQSGGRVGRARDTDAAGSLVLRGVDRREHKRGLVGAKKHGTKSGSGAPLQRGFILLHTAFWVHGSEIDNSIQVNILNIFIDRHMIRDNIYLFIGFLPMIAS